MKNNKSIISFIIGILILIALIVYLNSSQPKIKGGNSNVPCTDPNLPLLQHIHPVLKIFVDDKQEIVPTEIGITSSCEYVLHTHDDTGIIHVETQDARQYTLGDFLNVWGKSINRAGYNLKVTANGKSVENPTDLILKDDQQIEIDYTKN